MNTTTTLKQDIREHLGQFSLHLLLVFATGLTIGSERTVVPVLSEEVLGVHSAMYFLQIATGGLANPIGRRPPVIVGMFHAGAGVLGMVLVGGYLAWEVLSATSGLGMVLLYPNLITVPSVAAHPTWRSAGMGVYRMWRDSGYAVGAIMIGLSMEFVNAAAAFYMIALLMFVSGAVVSIWIEETHPDFGTYDPPAPVTEQPTKTAAHD